MEGKPVPPLPPVNFPIQLGSGDFQYDPIDNPKLVDFVAKESAQSLRMMPCACGEQKRAEKVTIDEMRMWRESKDDGKGTFFRTVSFTTCQLCQHKQRLGNSLHMSCEMEKAFKKQ